MADESTKALRATLESLQRTVPLLGEDGAGTLEETREALRIAISATVQLTSWAVSLEERLRD